MINQILKTYFKWRQKSLEKICKNPHYYQKAILSRIVSENVSSQFGMSHNFNQIKSLNEYRKAVPLQTYESISPSINKMLRGDKNVLCSDEITWFAKSSGTTTGRSKYIPVSLNYLNKGHLKCAWDAATIIYNEDPKANLFKDRSIIMGGSLEQFDKGIMAGDISAVIINHFPKIGEPFYTPDIKTALLPDWEEKIEKIAKITSTQNLTLLAGVPTWTIVLLNKILELTGKENISEVWPNLRSYLHGGVNFDPYVNEFKRLIPSDDVIYREVYNSSEGYFAIQDNKDIHSMLLLCNHEIYYEFIPMSEIHNSTPYCISLKQVERDKDYAIVISNTAGLYRYIIGDVVNFSSTMPYRINITGRINQQINVFGEELSIANASKALSTTCFEHKVDVNEFTIAPIFMKQGSAGAHEWWIEFRSPPKNIAAFEQTLDQELRKLNSDYDAKRSYDLTLKNLKIISVAKGTFENWYRSKNKYGGQNKIQKMRNDRVLVDELSKLSADRT